MKKLLFTMAAALAVAFGASAEGVTYDYTKAYETGLLDTYVSGNNMGTVTDVFGDNYENQIYVAANTGISADQYKSLKAATYIVDLGDEVGRVLCFNGVLSDFASKMGLSGLNTAPNIPFFHLYWFCNSKSENVRIKITYSVYVSSESSKPNIPNAVNIRGNNTNTTAFFADASGVSTSNFLNADNSWVNENNETRWCEYVVDVNNAQDAPLSIDFYIHGYKNGLYGNTVLIQKVEVTPIDDIEYSTANTSFVTKKIDPSANHTVVSLSEVTVGSADVTANTYKVDGSEFTGGEYEDYYSTVNALNLPFTITPDINETNKGEYVLTGTLNNTEVSFGKIADARTISGTISNLPFTDKYTLTVGEVSSTEDSESDAKYIGTATNEFKTEDVEFTFADNGDENVPQIYYHNSPNYDKPVNAVIFVDKIGGVDKDHNPYFAFNIATDDSNLTTDADLEETATDIYAGVLSEKAVVLNKVPYGLEGYNPANGATNWSTLAAKADAVPLQVAGIQAGQKITRTLKVVYPFLEKLTVTVEGEETQTAENEFLNLNSNVSSKTADPYTINAEDISAAQQTSVANIAVDGNGKVEFFNLQGVSVDANALTPGLYIRRAGGKASKVIVK